MKSAYNSVLLEIFFEFVTWPPFTEMYMASLE